MNAPRMAKQGSALTDPFKDHGGAGNGLTVNDTSGVGNFAHTEVKGAAPTET